MPITTKLVNGTIPVRYVKFNSVGINDLVLPICIDSKKKRDEINSILSSPKYNGYLMEEQARRIYEENKHNGDAIMLMNDF